MARPKRFTVRLSVEEYDYLKVLAQQYQVSRSDIIRLLIASQYESISDKIRNN